MSALTLPLKAIYFNQIKAGVKHWEYRLCTPYWMKRLAKAPFDKLVLTLGYPAADDTGKRLVLPWRGFVYAKIQHEHFGDQSVMVFAIQASENATHGHFQEVL